MAADRDSKLREYTQAKALSASEDRNTDRLLISCLKVDVLAVFICGEVSFSVGPETSPLTPFKCDLKVGLNFSELNRALKDSLTVETIHDGLMLGPVPLLLISRVVKRVTSLEVRVEELVTQISWLSAL